MRVDGVTKFFMHRPVLFWSLVAGIVVAGVVCFDMMPKLEDPAVNAKQAAVVVLYPGATAHEVELKVAQVMEEQMNTLPDIDNILTDCSPGMLYMTVKFTMEVLEKDVEEHFDILRRKVNDIKMYLPQDCSEPIVVDDMLDTYGIFYALTGEGYTYPELEKYAKFIRRGLMKVEGVKRINIVGGRSEVINITLSKEQIARNGLMPTQIMLSLSSAGKSVTGGKMDIDGYRIPIMVNNAIEDENDIADMVLSLPTGGTVRLGDIARIERTYAEPQTNAFFVGSQEAIAICVAMEADAIVPDVGRAVTAEMDNIMKSVPAGMEIHKVFFQPDRVTHAIKGFMLNLIQSVLIVILVLVFAMGFRSGAIIGMGLVLTICLSFPILLMMGSTLQRISLGAFIISMGMLVDNAIVIMDGILVDRQKGLEAGTYLFRIGNNTALPLLGATVIAVSCFVTVYLCPDTAGEYCHDLFLVMCVSLLCSWFLALVQVPVTASVWLPAKVNPADNTNAMNGRMHRLVRKVVSTLMCHRAVTICVALVFLALAGLGMTKVKNLFFPDFEYNQMIIEYFLPTQSSPDRVRHDLLEITDRLMESDKVEAVYSSMGVAPAHYTLVRPMTRGGDRYGELIVDCKDFKTINKLIHEIRSEMREDYPDAYIRFKHYNFSISSTHPVEAIFHGPDPAVLRDLAEQAKEIMRNCEYVDPYSVQDNWHPMGKVLIADYNKQDALRNSIQRGDVANALQAATSGMTVGVLYDQDNIVPVNLFVRNEDGSKITELNDIPVWGTMNINIDTDALSGLVTGASDISSVRNDMFRASTMSSITNDVSLGWEEEFIHRMDGQRAIEVECDPNPDVYLATPASTKKAVKAAIEAIPLPEGYTLSWEGEGGLSGRATANLIKNIPIPVFVVIFVLLLLFNSWRRLALIIFCLPFAVCGIAPALLLFHQPFTFMAIIGSVGLGGMMVKNGIVLVDEIHRLRTQENQTPWDAVVNATVSRTRPVLMASLTTILGMFPLLSDPMYSSMAVCIMSGLTVGTLITLVLLPVFYSALFRIRRPQSNQIP